MTRLRPSWSATRPVAAVPIAMPITYMVTIQVMVSGVALNERVLSNIAEVTGGDYFRATNASTLENIYLAIDKLEPVEYKYQSHRPRSELFTIPLTAGILIMVFFTAWSVWRSRSSGVS